MNNLQEKSKIYYAESDVYDVFSRIDLITPDSTKDQRNAICGGSNVS